MASTYTLFNGKVIHNGPRIRVNASYTCYRSGGKMYYRINTTIPSLDTSSSWFGYNIQMTVYIDGSLKCTQTLKGNSPTTWGTISNKTSYYAVAKTSGSTGIKLVFSSSNGGGISGSYSSGMKVLALSTDGTITITGTDEQSMTINISGLPTGYSKYLYYDISRDNKTWTNVGMDGAGSARSALTMTIPNLSAGQLYYFRMREYVDSNLVVTKYANVTLPPASGTLTGSAEEAKVTLTQTLNAEVSIGRTLQWLYRPSGATSWIDAGIDNIPTPIQADTKTIDGLTTGQRYDFAAVLRAGEDVLNTFLTAITLPGSSAKVTAESSSYSTIAVNISGMIASGWARTIKLYYKTAAETEYTWYKTITTESNTASIMIECLKAYTKYMIKATISRDDVLIATTEIAVQTQEMGYVAMPVIQSIVSTIMTKQAVIAWISPDDRVEMSYDVLYSTDNVTYQNLLTTDYISPLTIELPAGNTDYFIKIKGYATDSTKEALSKVVPVYTFFSFAYDTDISADAEIKLTGKEVNRLIKFVNKRKSTSIAAVAVGENVKAAKYNEIKNALGITSADVGTTIDIGAADLQAFATEVNKE